MQIDQFQRLMKDLYFKNDASRGIHRTAIWLTEELGELMKELKKDQVHMDKSAIREEMADVLAWVASLANLLEIDLDEAVQLKYPGVCARCGLNPCECNKNLP